MLSDNKDVRVKYAVRTVPAILLEPSHNPDTDPFPTEIAAFFRLFRPRFNVEKVRFLFFKTVAAFVKAAGRYRKLADRLPIARLSKPRIARQVSFYTKPKSARSFQTPSWIAAAYTPFPPPIFPFSLYE
jgi:hypothetical protein